MVLWCHVASPERTNPVSIWRVKPWASSKASLTPSGLRDSSSRARRASRPRRRFRGGFPIGNSGPSPPPLHLFITFGERRLRLVQAIGHPLIGRRDWPPRTCLRSHSALSRTSQWGLDGPDDFLDVLTRPFWQRLAVPEVARNSSPCAAPRPW